MSVVWFCVFIENNSQLDETSLALMSVICNIFEDKFVRCSDFIIENDYRRVPVFSDPLFVLVAPELFRLEFCLSVLIEAACGVAEYLCTFLQFRDLRCPAHLQVPI